MPMIKHKRKNKSIFKRLKRIFAQKSRYKSYENMIRLNMHLREY